MTDDELAPADPLDPIEVAITDIDGQIEHTEIRHGNWLLITHGCHVSNEVRYGNGTVVVTIKPGQGS